MKIDKPAFKRTLTRCREKLLDARQEGGYWEGRLSSSALSTATAVCALALTDRERHEERIGKGLAWLVENQNRDGGYGDTVISRSNISTTTLGWAAFSAAVGTEHPEPAIEKAGQWLEREAGDLQAHSLAKAISTSYGRDRTFSVPILTMCALCGRLGAGREAWRLVKPLPFELAAMPHAWLKWMHLTVVSYALPALVAIGQVRHQRCPTANPMTRLVRDLTRKKTLRLLEQIQPRSGGFLEAIPLTSFVVMSLASAGRKKHPVVEKGVAFLTRSMRDDGSWPIDTNLATWLTTLSVNSFAGSPTFSDFFDGTDQERIAEWLLGQQNREIHPFTRAEPGGWAWTDLPGGVPDADDTAGALLALHHLGMRSERVGHAVQAGIKWLAGLQNRNGGIPTFCRGWGKLPFDRSAPDLTAHALAAMGVWSSEKVLPPSMMAGAKRFMNRGTDYLRRVQRKDGAWIPLWFGNESAPEGENPVYGTARVLSALAGLSGTSGNVEQTMRNLGVQWLIRAQNPDGGWGGAPGVTSTIEETALAVHALARLGPRPDPALWKGVAWLIERTREGEVMEPAPIGLYFARLWYYEQLYPLIFTLQALGQVDNLIS